MNSRVRKSTDLSGHASGCPSRGQRPSSGGRSWPAPWPASGGADSRATPDAGRRACDQEWGRHRGLARAPAAIAPAAPAGHEPPRHESSQIARVKPVPELVLQQPARDQRMGPERSWRAAGSCARSTEVSRSITGPCDHRPTPPGAPRAAPAREAPRRSPGRAASTTLGAPLRQGGIGQDRASLFSRGNDLGHHSVAAGHQHGLAGGSQADILAQLAVRYLQADGQADKARDEDRFDGMWVLRTHTELTAAESTLRYQRLWMVEQVFRTAKSRLDTRPHIPQDRCHHLRTCLLLVPRAGAARRALASHGQRRRDRRVGRHFARTEAAITYNGRRPPTHASEHRRFESRRTLICSAKAFLVPDTR